jgi:hypothetical protein
MCDALTGALVKHAAGQAARRALGQSTMQESLKTCFTFSVDDDDSILYHASASSSCVWQVRKSTTHIPTVMCDVLTGALESWQRRDR